MQDRQIWCKSTPSDQSFKNAPNDYRIRSKATPQVENGQRAGRISKVRNVPKCRIRAMATPIFWRGQRKPARASKVP